MLHMLTLVPDYLRNTSKERPSVSTTVTVLEFVLACGALSPPQYQRVLVLVHVQLATPDQGLQRRVLGR